VKPCAWTCKRSKRSKDPPESGDPNRGVRNGTGRFPGREAVERNASQYDQSRCRLYRKGPGMEAKLCFIGHGLTENRSGLIVDASSAATALLATPSAHRRMIRHRSDIERATRRRRTCRSR
jgi:hypothetical protein